MATNWANANSFSGSRVNADFSTTIYGTFNRNYSGTPAPSVKELVFTLAASGSSLTFVSSYGNTIYITLIKDDLSVFVPMALDIDANGSVELLEPPTGWPTTGTYFFTIQSTIIGSTTAAAFSSEIAPNFLETS